MNFLFPPPASTNRPGIVQARLMQLATGFILVMAVILTLSPAVRVHSWVASYRWEHWAGVAAWLAGFTLCYRVFQRYIPEQDPYLLPLVALLTGWGLMTIWRLSVPFGLRQTIWLAIGTGVLVIGARIRSLPQILRRYKYIWLFLGILLVVLTFFFGTYPSGAGPRLWLGCCGVYFQPTELLKLLLILYLAAYLADQIPLQASFPRLIFPTLVLFGVVAVLLLGQRDLGTTILFLFFYAATLYLATGYRRILWISAGTILLFAVIGYLMFDVIRLRVDAWLNPWADPAGRSYQIVQSLIALAAGGIEGRGVGMGSPSLVPIAHSDFIFSAVAEETGLLGVIGLIVCLALLTARGFRIALYARDAFERYLAAGLTLMLITQSILIIAGNIRLLPLTGVTLPFMSYGGSSLLTTCFSALLLIHLSARGETEPATLSRPVPIRVVHAILLAGLGGIALYAGWWSFLNRESLLARNDNLRHIVSDRFTPRGDIVDRHGEELTTTMGKAGNFNRAVRYIPLSHILGFSHPVYGQAGLESSLNDVLRGLQGYPSATMVWNEVLYSQPPPGLDLRLSIDLETQRLADALLGEATGALVLLNARTGEILAVASHPYYDANQLDDTYPVLRDDPTAPFFNRALQGAYPPGSAVAPFLLAISGSPELFPALPTDLSFTLQGQTLRCRVAAGPSATWTDALRDGCPAALATLATRLQAEQIIQMYRSAGFYVTPNLPLPVLRASIAGEVKDLAQTALGMDGLTVSPLQMALAAASLSNNGTRPAPRIATAVENPSGGWIALPPGADAVYVLPTTLANQTAAALANDALPFWSVIGRAFTRQGKPITWFVGGTLPGWQGPPLAVAVVIEGDDANRAEQVGVGVLSFSQNLK